MTAEALAVVRILEILERFPWEERAKVLTEVLRWGGRIPPAKMNGPETNRRAVSMTAGGAGP